MGQDQRNPPQGMMQNGPMMGDQNGGSSFGQGPNGQEMPRMIDFDAMVTKGIISQETCDQIKAFMEAHRPDGMPGMDNQFPNGQTSDMNGQKVGPGMNGHPGRGQRNGGGLLHDLFSAGIITQTGYEALSAAELTGRPVMLVHHEGSSFFSGCIRPPNMIEFHRTAWSVVRVVEGAALEML